MNSLHEEFDSKGLTVLAITRSSEDRDKTFAWIENQGADFAWAFAEDGKLHEMAGVKGIPHAALFDASGQMVWTGSPYSLNKKAVKDALKGASKTFTFGWGKDYASVAKMVLADQYASALDKVDGMVGKGTEGAADVRASIERKLDRKVASMESSLKKGDYYAALVIAEALDGNLGEMEQAAKVTSTLESMDGDSEIEHVIGGQKKLAKIAGGKLGKTREVQSAIKKAEQLAKKYDGTIVETQARDFVKRMRARLAAKK